MATLHFEGDQDFAQPPEVVRARLTDARFLAECIPDRQSTGEATAESVVCTIRPGLSFVRGTLEVTLRVAEASAGAARLTLHSKGIGSSSDVEAALAFALRDGGTRVHWTADVTNLGGLLKAVPQGLLKAAAQKVIGDVWASIATRMGG